MTTDHKDAAEPVGSPVVRPVRPTAWMVRQGSRTYYVSDAEFVRSSYDSGEFVPLYGPEAQAAERERWREIAHRVAADANRYGREGLRLRCTISKGGGLVSWEADRA